MSRVMKKYVKILLVFLLFLVLIVGETGAQRGQQAGQQLVEAGNRGMETAIQSLNRVSERNNNPEIGEQIREMVQRHEKIQTKTALQQMSQRKQLVKLLIGPDYKNAGQVRSDVVGLRNDIRQLTRIQEKALPIDAGDVQGAIDELQAEADDLEAQLAEQVSGFSLFGWLSRLLSQY